MTRQKILTLDAVVIVDVRGDLAAKHHVDNAFILFEPSLHMEGPQGLAFSFSPTTMAIVFPGQPRVVLSGEGGLEPPMTSPIEFTARPNGHIGQPLRSSRSLAIARPIWSRIGPFTITKGAVGFVVVVGPR